jgi:hypothetical protein
VTHQHHDKKWVPQSRSPKFFFAGLPPRTPPKWQLSLGHFANPPLTRALADPGQKSGKFHAKIAFFLFFRRKLWHNFVTPFSTFANILGLHPD